MGWIWWDRCKKLQLDFVGWTFVLIAPVQYVLHQLSCTYKTIPNAPKYYEMHRNISSGSNGVDGVRSLRKITTRLCGTNLCINCTSLVCLATSLGSNGVDWVRSLRKMTSWFRGTNFCKNWTSSVCFATSFMQLRNDTKCTQILRNAPKYRFWVQWGGLGAFVAKNDVVTSWHELL